MSVVPFRLEYPLDALCRAAEEHGVDSLVYRVINHAIATGTVHLVDYDGVCRDAAAGTLQEPPFDAGDATDVILRQAIGVFERRGRHLDRGNG